MLYCDKCKVSVTGSRARCPLCQNPLSGQPAPESGRFPVLPDHFRQHSLIIRLLLFLSFAAVVICVAIDTLLPKPVRWSYYVMAAIPCLWVCMANVFVRRHHLSKNILWMVFWVSLLALTWDYFTGWHRWSLNYVIPFVCVAAMAAVAVISKAMHQKIDEYMIYLVVDCLFGIVPLLFLLMQWVTVRYPSVLCVVVSLLSLAALGTFQSDQMKSEFKKRLHF